MSLKDNVNRLHIELSNTFTQVDIFEKSHIKYGNYIEFSINENGLNLRAIIYKRDLEKNNFEWKYLSNPNNDESIVERNSSTDSFLEDVIDIFYKNRFDSDYINSIK
jgi:hypothetical protein